MLMGHIYKMFGSGGQANTACGDSVENLRTQCSSLSFISNFRTYRDLSLQPELELELEL